MKSNLSPISVELISSNDEVLNVWNITRPHQKLGIKDNEIKRMGLPVNGFANYNLKITASLLFRDLMFTVRPISPWAISNRAVPFTPGNMSLSKEEFELLSIEDQVIVDEQLYKVIENVMLGKELQDYAKNYLPRITSTTFCVNMNLRTILNYVFTLFIHYPKYYSLIGEKILNAISISKDQFSDFSKSDLYNKLALTDRELSINSHTYLGGEMHYLPAEGSGNLISQFIRQHNSVVKNGLYNELTDDFIGALKKTQNDLVKAGSYLDEDSLNNLIKTRSCFFSMMDKEDKNSWSSIIGSYVDKMSPKEFINKLPCKGCKDKCKVEKDMVTRVHRLDCNIPCPILLENPDPITERIEKFCSDSKIMKMWSNCKDLITINPDNESNKIYYGSKKN